MVGRAQDRPPGRPGYDIHDFDGSIPRLVAATGCHIWSPYHRNVDPTAMAEAKAASLRVIPWTVNQPQDMERLIDLGVDGLISDYPDRLRAVLADRNIPLPAPVHMP